MCDKKLEILEKRLDFLTKEDLIVAFSGGIDSSLLLKIACLYAEKNGNTVYAVTFSTKLHPMKDLEIAEKVALECRAKWVVLPVDETQIKEIQMNPVDRCYYCKRYLFTKLKEYASKLDIRYIVEGSNAEDERGYRPGMKAVKELSIISPLLEAGLWKEEIRTIAREKSLSVAERPSAPCMATRLPYGTKINIDVLKKLELGEEFLKGLGFLYVRIRFHEPILRIEIEKEKFGEFIEKEVVITKKMHELGYRYVTLDLDGFRSGSMDWFLDVN